MWEAITGVVIFILGYLFKGWEKKLNETEKFKAKVIDVIAISTAEGYTNRQNQAEKRRMARAALQLERLGNKQLAKNIRTYMWKWAEVYNIAQAYPKTSNQKEEEKRKLKLIKELDILTEEIASPTNNKFIKKIIELWGKIST